MPERPPGARSTRHTRLRAEGQRNPGMAGRLRSSTSTEERKEEEKERKREKKKVSMETSKKRRRDRERERDETEKETKNRVDSAARSCGGEYGSHSLETNESLDLFFSFLFNGESKKASTSYKQLTSF